MKRAIGVAGAALLLSSFGLVPAQAETSVSVGGDSNWKVTVSSTTPTNYTTLNKRLHFSGKYVYDAHVLGVPIPVRGYYLASGPYTPFARPTMISSDAALSSNTFSLQWDSRTGANGWIVSGSKSFWGDATVNISEDATSDTRAAGYVHHGTGSGHATDENAVNYIKGS